MSTTPPPSPFPASFGAAPKRKPRNASSTPTHLVAVETTPAVTARVYTIAEAAIVLRMPKSSLYAAIRTQEIHSITVGKSRRIPIWVVDALLGVPFDGEQVNRDAA